LFRKLGRTAPRRACILCTWANILFPCPGSHLR
jgi:hypothetical protein